MRFCKDFNDYELIDAVSGERLERWGDIILIRPDPQIIWDAALMRHTFRKIPTKDKLPTS